MLPTKVVDAACKCVYLLGRAPPSHNLKFTQKTRKSINCHFCARHTFSCTWHIHVVRSRAFSLCTWHVLVQWLAMCQEVLKLRVKEKRSSHKEGNVTDLKENGKPMKKDKQGL